MPDGIVSLDKMSTNMMPYSNSGQLGIFVRPLYSLSSAQHHHHLLHHRCTTPAYVSLTAVLKPQRHSNERGFRSRVVSWSTPQVRSMHCRNVRYARHCSESPRICSKVCNVYWGSLIIVAATIVMMPPRLTPSGRFSPSGNDNGLMQWSLQGPFGILLKSRCRLSIP